MADPEIFIVSRLNDCFGLDLTLVDFDEKAPLELLQRREEGLIALREQLRTRKAGPTPCALWTCYGGTVAVRWAGLANKVDIESINPVSSPNVKGRGVSPATPCCVPSGGSLL